MSQEIHGVGIHLFSVNYGDFSMSKIDLEEMEKILQAMGEKAVLASRRLAGMSTEEKNNCLLAMADAIEAESDYIKTENEKDLKAGEKNGLSSAMLDRLKLTDERIKAMADGLRHVTTLNDPVGNILTSLTRPNGLLIEKVSVPIGVIGIVYESRPNVTIDAAGLCLKAGNAVILRGGKEAINSNMALAHCINHPGAIPEGAVQLIPWTDREAVGKLLKMDSYIDLIIPRGGEGLIKAVVAQSTIPVIKHYKGICSMFVDADCDQQQAVDIVINAKCQRPGVCNAIENLLIHKDIAEEFAPKIARALLDNNVQIKGDEQFCRLVPESLPASENDWYEEYLDLIISVKVVNDVTEAVDFINTYGSRHSDAILTQNTNNAEKFLAEVDSSTVYVNASTRFTDGGEFGMGAEIGISTDKLHARGPMGLPELTTYKYIVRGNGQIR
jgi:glutamate-5-semialdehyde dehydrogenase